LLPRRVRTFEHPLLSDLGALMLFLPVVAPSRLLIDVARMVGRRVPCEPDGNGEGDSNDDEDRLRAALVLHEALTAPCQDLVASLLVN
jgi:hypothetical protein